MKIGDRVSVVVRHAKDGRVTGKSVRRARVMVTGKQNFGRLRVRFEGSKDTGWIHSDDANEEGTEWARGWYGIDAKALCAAVAMEKTPAR